MQTFLKLAFAVFMAVPPVVIALRLVDRRATSLRSLYQAELRELERRTQRAAPTLPVTDDDLVALPPPVRTYLRRAKVVGKPRVRSVHAVLRGKMRGAADAARMDVEAEQHNYFGSGAPARLFFL